MFPRDSGEAHNNHIFLLSAQKIHALNTTSFCYHNQAQIKGGIVGLFFFFFRVLNYLLFIKMKTWPSYLKIMTEMNLRQYFIWLQKDK